MSEYDSVASFPVIRGLFVLLLSIVFRLDIVSG